MKKLIALILVIWVSMGAEAESFRALCIGVSNYDDGRVRIGGYNSVRGVYDALTYCHPDIPITMLVDPSGDELFSALGKELSRASKDETFIVYINSHGGSQGLLNWLEARDGSRITPAMLRSALEKAPGRVILIIDCCMSGGFIGAGSNADEFLNGLIRGSGLTGGTSAFPEDRFMAIMSSSFDQNSYRIAASSASEENMSTVFSRSMCEALGWDLIYDRPTTLKADMDNDSKVSFNELCAYVRQRCMYYLSFSSPARQTVQFTPLNSALILADRSERRNPK